MPSTWEAMSERMLAKEPVVLPDRGVAGQDPEAVGVGLDVVQQGQGGLLDQLPRPARGQRAPDPVQQGADLAVDDHGVEALLAAEVLVHDRLADLGLGRDLLHRGALETAVCEQGAGHADELFAPLGAGHPDPAGPPRAYGIAVLRGRAAMASSVEPPADGPKLGRAGCGPSTGLGVVTIPGWSVGRARLTLNQD